MRRRPAMLALLAAAAIAVTGCAHGLAPPSSMRWGLPVYPRAGAIGASTAGPQFALYHTADRFEDVYAWYATELPAGTPHALSPAKREATFALFDPASQRTVHLAADASGTAIAFTRQVSGNARQRAR